MIDDPIKALTAALDVDPTPDFRRRVKAAVADQRPSPWGVGTLLRATAGLVLATASVLLVVSLAGRLTRPTSDTAALPGDALAPWTPLAAVSDARTPPHPVADGRAAVINRRRIADVQISSAETAALRQLFRQGAAVAAPPTVDEVVIPELSIAALDPSPTTEGVQK